MFFLALATLVAGAHAGELPRRGTLGLALAPSADGNGLKVVQVMNPNAGAAVAVDDVVLTINGKPLTGPKGVGTGGATYGIKPGDKVKVEIVRGGAAQTIEVVAIAAPPPSLDGRAIEMGTAQAKGGPRVRTYLLEPADKKLARRGKLPAVMILPGINCGTVEAFAVAGHPYTKLFKMFSGAGFVAVMADKPGQGDSEGTPCFDGGFDVEVEAFKAAAASFVADKRIDAKRFYIVGLSMGGLQAPLVSEAVPAAGIVSWGGLTGRWYDYLLTTVYRRAVLQGDDPVASFAFNQHWRRVLSAVFVDGKAPETIQREMPEAFAAVAGSEDSDLTSFAGRAWVFHREVDRAPIVRAWNAYKGRLLALHGEFDWVSEMHDHRLAADIVNRLRPGEAAFEVVAGNDHVNTKHKSLADSFAKFGQGEADDTFFTRCVAWIAGLAGT